MPTGHRFLATDLHQFVVSLFTHLGSTPGEATLVADHLIAANLAGHDSHGVGMIPSYVKSHAGGFLQLNRHATVTKDAGAVVTLDGNAGFGQVVAHEAMQLGIEKAKQHGMAAIALRNAHHVGRIGYWAEQCAAAGLISIHFVSVIGDPMVAPFRGKDSRFGTNPLCVVFPRAGHPPLLLDYATSAIAFGKTRVAWHKGEAVAPGCLIDAAGRPTTDPAVIRLGVYVMAWTVPFNVLFMPVEVFAGAMRGTGYSVVPTVITCMCVCVFRVVWIFTVVRTWHRIELLAVCYPLSWLLAATVFAIVYFRGGWLRRRIAQCGMEPEVRA